MHQNRFALVLVSLLTVALVACNDSEGENGEAATSAVSPSSAPVAVVTEGTFTLDGSPHGTVAVKGYGYVEGVHEPFCEKDCENHEYVFFQVLSSDDEDFDRYVKQNEGNAYVREGAIGIGCRDGETIVFTNDSDAAGRQTISLRRGIADAILESSENDLVTLILTKDELTGGAETPVCYSHLTDVTIAAEKDPAASAPAATSAALSSDAMTSAGPSVSGGCIVAGCSGELCVDASEEEIFSPCVWKEEFACYKTATCERQVGGSCAWTMTAELQSCLTNSASGIPSVQ